MTSPPKSVPHGYCHCGCGGKTTIADRNKTATGMVKGQPMRFIVGHRVKPKPVDFDTKPFKIDGVYCRLIPLTMGFYSIVDAADYEWLMQWSWHVHRAGTRKGDGGYYAVRSRDPKRMHRLILGADVGTGEPDHINRCGIDNRRKNLRHSTHGENCQNRSQRTDNTTGFRGVSKHWKKYRAEITVNGARIRLGVFATPEEAARAYDKAAREYHDAFAAMNF